MLDGPDTVLTDRLDTSQSKKDMIDFTYNWKAICFSKINFDLCIKIGFKGGIKKIAAGFKTRRYFFYSPFEANLYTQVKIDF